MAAYDLEEQEQIDEIKTWWKMYGNRLINVVLVVALLFAAWQGWNVYQNMQAGQASAVYSALQKAVQDKDLARMKAAGDELFEKYGTTQYAALGGLLAAKTFNELGDTKAARLQLERVSDKSTDELRDMARLRLATLMIDDKEYDAALKYLDGAASAGFAARFSDTRGDILVAQDKKSDALKAYQTALNKLAELDKLASSQAPTNAIYRELLRQKLDALAGN